MAQTADPARRLEAMLRIRRFEEQVLRMAEAQAFPGHFHVYIGQEATIPFSPPLESALLVTPEKIAEAVLTTVNLPRLEHRI